MAAKTQAPVEEFNWEISEEMLAELQAVGISDEQAKEMGIAYVQIIQALTSNKPEGSHDGQFYSPNGVIPPSDEITITPYFWNRKRGLAPKIGSSVKMFYFCQSPLDNGIGYIHRETGSGKWLPTGDIRPCDKCPYNKIRNCRPGEEFPESDIVPSGKGYKVDDCRAGVYMCGSLYTEFPSMAKVSEQPLVMLVFPILITMSDYRKVDTTKLTEKYGQPVYNFRKLWEQINALNVNTRHTKIRIVTSTMEHTGTHHVPFFMWEKNLKYLHGTRDTKDDVDEYALFVESQKLQFLTLGNQFAISHAKAIEAGEYKSPFALTAGDPSLTTEAPEAEAPPKVELTPPKPRQAEEPDGDEGEQMTIENRPRR